MVTKQLKKITQEEFDKALQNHFLYQKGGHDAKKMSLRNRDFGDVKIMGSDLSFADFNGSNLSSLIGYDSSSGISSRQVYQTVFTGANCRGVNFGTIDLSKAASLKDTILIDAIFDSRKLTDKQKSEAIFTEEQYKSFLEEKALKASKQDIIIAQQIKDLKEKNETLKKTSENQSRSMLSIFQEQRLSFLREEVLWMIFSACIFLTIFTIAETMVAFLNPGLATIILSGVIGGIVFVGVILSWIDKTDIETQKFEWNLISIGKSILKTVVILLVSMVAVTLINSSVNKWNIIICKTSDMKDCIPMEEARLAMLPITFILLSLLWFSIHQYGRAKKLRIEQQNKQAMIHFMQAVIANDGKASKENQTFPILAPFFANAIIHRPFSQENYEPQLPVDTLFKMAKDTKDIIK